MPRELRRLICLLVGVQAPLDPVQEALAAGGQVFGERCGCCAKPRAGPAGAPRRGCAPGGTHHLKGDSQHRSCSASMPSRSQPCSCPEMQLGMPEFATPLKMEKRVASHDFLSHLLWSGQPRRQALTSLVGDISAAIEGNAFKLLNFCDPLCLYIIMLYFWSCLHFDFLYDFVLFLEIKVIFIYYEGCYKMKDWCQPPCLIGAFM